ncbi:hypothetical protein [Natrinema versiforme]|uniref:DUF8159 domain-containing protein n=1 Tax=Natrinema versiforme TaxID=88724 RepID=A0A4P8WHC9_9EURY|nr:hypothetical protein [Natrinema versiforme]QCS42442.1 hypothetical protein FEJ81_08735 [Natrinema versiforme]
MTDDSPHGPSGSSRRRFLGTAVAVGTAATAGCVGSLLGTTGSDENEIEPVEPSEPREGTPGEFYALVERNDLSVQSLRKDGSDLVLVYESNAATESESTTELEVITTVYNENLVKNDAGIDMLYAEVANPFEGQAHGWGVKTEWCERYNAAVDGGEDGGNESSSDDGGSSDGIEGDDGSGNNETESGNTSADDGTTNNASANETEGGMSAADTAAMILMSNVLNSRVYAEDLED